MATTCNLDHSFSGKISLYQGWIQAFGKKGKSCYFCIFSLFIIQLWSDISHRLVTLVSWAVAQLTISIVSPRIDLSWLCICKNMRPTSVREALHPLWTKRHLSQILFCVKICFSELRNHWSLVPYKFDSKLSLKYLGAEGVHFFREKCWVHVSKTQASSSVWSNSIYLIIFGYH